MTINGLPGYKIDKIVDFILDYGSSDGSHHKQWVLDQVLRKLLDDEYFLVVNNYERINETEWETGVAP